MSGLGKLERIILVPRNGLGNRLQAWSSAAILAQDWDVPLEVIWEPESSAPTPHTQLFLGEPFLPARHTFRERAYLDDVLGGPHESVPRYLWRNDQRGLVTLAGHDRGEQVFIPQLLEWMFGASQPITLVIIAGGLFTTNPSAFRGRREDFYRSLSWHPTITTAVNALDTSHPYAALHIRQTDRSIEAPANRSIARALHRAREAGHSSLFIAADNVKARDEWMTRARHMGFQPWTASATEFSRSASEGGISSAIDWLFLSRARDLIFPAASTFSAEAAVAAGTAGTPLTASAARQAWRKFTMHTHNAVMFPQRHWLT